MLAYTLNKPIDCNRVCHDIQQLINEHSNIEPDSEKVLIINIQSIIDEQPRVQTIEYKPNCPS